MTRLLAAALLVLLAPAARAQPSDAMPAHPPGWVRQASSMLFYDEAGNLAVELPLTRDEQAAGPRVVAHEIIGNVSPNARFAWTLERTITWTTDRSRVVSSRRLLRFYGSDGKELWSSSEVEKPEKNDPLLFSNDGETLMVALRNGANWTVSVKGYVGNTIVDVGPAPVLQLMSLTPNGKYGMVRWAVPDQTDTHTFVDVAARVKLDIPSSELHLTFGNARIDDNGKVYSGKKVVYDFPAAAAKKAAADGLPPKP